MAAKYTTRKSTPAAKVQTLARKAARAAKRQTGAVIR